MKKKKIGYGKRLAAIIVSAVITAAGAFSLIAFGILGMPSEKEVSTGWYSCVSEIAYSPVLKQGAYYNDGSVEFGSIYIASFVEKLGLSCNYRFTSDSAADLEGSYIITATLEGVLNQSVVWRKEYLLGGGELTGFELEKPLTLELGEYRSFIEQMEKETSIKPDVTMAISYNVNASAQVAGKSVSENSVSTLLIPLSNPLMQFSGQPVSSIENTLSDTVPTIIKLTNLQLAANIAVLTLTLSLLIYVLFFTSGQRYALAQRQLDKIFKHYGGRIVELKPDTNLRANNLIIVKSFKDLLLTADELKKPILKTGGEDFMNTSFLVVDEPWQYVFHASSLAEKPYQAANASAG